MTGFDSINGSMNMSLSKFWEISGYNAKTLKTNVISTAKRNTHTKTRI